MGIKNWTWNRNKRYDRQQEEIKKGKVYPEEKLFVSRAIQSVRTQLRWFTKENNSLALKSYHDGIEKESGFYFTIPWLMHFHVKSVWDWNAFRKRFPHLVENDVGKSWGFFINRTFLSFKWGYVPEDYINQSPEQGFRRDKDWSDIIRGKLVDVLWSKSEVVLRVNREITTTYRTDQYDKEVITVRHSPVVERGYDLSNSPVGVTIPITVYKKTGTWVYKRWFNKQHIIYGVASDVGIIVPGKGENSWDQDDEIIQSKYDFNADDCDFTTGEATTPSEAVDIFLKSIRRKLNR